MPDHGSTAGNASAIPPVPCDDCVGYLPAMHRLLFVEPCVPNSSVPDGKRSIAGRISSPEKTGRRDGIQISAVAKTVGANRKNVSSSAEWFQWFFRNVGRPIQQLGEQFFFSRSPCNQRERHGKNSSPEPFAFFGGILVGRFGPKHPMAASGNTFALAFTCLPLSFAFRENFLGNLACSPAPRPFVPHNLSFVRYNWTKFRITTCAI